MLGEWLGRIREHPRKAAIAILWSLVLLILPRPREVLQWLADKSYGETAFKALRSVWNDGLPPVPLTAVSGFIADYWYHINATGLALWIGFLFWRMSKSERMDRATDEIAKIVFDSRDVNHVQPGLVDMEGASAGSRSPCDEYIYALGIVSLSNKPIVCRLVLEASTPHNTSEQRLARSMKVRNDPNAQSAGDFTLYLGDGQHPGQYIEVLQEVVPHQPGVPAEIRLRYANTQRASEHWFTDRGEHVLMFRLEGDFAKPIRYGLRVRYEDARRRWRVEPVRSPTGRALDERQPVGSELRITVLEGMPHLNLESPAETVEKLLDGTEATSSDTAPTLKINCGDGGKLFGRDISRAVFRDDVADTTEYFGFIEISASEFVENCVVKVDGIAQGGVPCEGFVPSTLRWFGQEGEGADKKSFIGRDRVYLLMQTLGSYWSLQAMKRDNAKVVFRPGDYDLDIVVAGQNARPCYTSLLLHVGAFRDIFVRARDESRS